MCGGRNLCKRWLSFWKQVGEAGLRLLVAKEHEPCRTLWSPGMAIRRRQSRRSRCRAGDNAAERRCNRGSDTMMVDQYRVRVSPRYWVSIRPGSRGTALNAEGVFLIRKGVPPVFAPGGRRGGSRRKPRPSVCVAWSHPVGMDAETPRKHCERKDRQRSKQDRSTQE